MPLDLTIVTPSGPAYRGDVDSVVLPGSEGDFGVLPGHAPLISEVRPGVIAVFDGGQVQERIFVAGGFAEVTAERCTVLAEQAMPVSDIDRAAADAGLKDAREDLGEAKGDTERAAAERAIAVAEAKLAALDSPVY